VIRGQVIDGQTRLALCGGKCKAVADFLSVLYLAVPIATDGKLNPLTEHERLFIFVEGAARDPAGTRMA
jgi:hypothetical protein